MEQKINKQGEEQILIKQGAGESIVRGDFGWSDKFDSNPDPRRVKKVKVHEVRGGDGEEEHKAGRVGGRDEQDSGEEVLENNGQACQMLKVSEDVHPLRKSH